MSRGTAVIAGIAAGGIAALALAAAASSVTAYDIVEVVFLVMSLPLL